MAIIIEDIPLNIDDNDIYKKQSQERRGFANLRRLKGIIVGSGDYSVRISKDGLWAGAADFIDALFKVSINGVFTIKGLTSSSHMDPSDDNVYDLGNLNTKRWRILRVGTSAVIGDSGGTNTTINANSIFAGGTITVKGTTATEGTSAKILPVSSDTGWIGQSGNYWRYLYVNNAFGKNPWGSFQEHDDIQLAKNVGAKMIEVERNVKVNGKNKKIKENKLVWDPKTFPIEIFEDNDRSKHYSIPDSMGFLIGTIKQLIDRVEILESNK